MHDLHDLLTRLERDLTLRQYRPNTRKNYLLYARLFLQSLDRPIDQIREDDIKAYLLDQIENHHRSHASYRQIYAALKFFFTVTLGRPNEVARIPFPRKSKSYLPPVLSPQEVQSLLDAFVVPKYRALFLTCYAAGLRITEACQLHVADVDSKSMVLHIRDGKGGRERLAVLTPRLLQELRMYWVIDRPRLWLFPSQNPQFPLCADSARRALAQAAIDAELTRPCTPHTLRHCFATHLLNAGVEVVVLQKLLGHASARTTERYTQVSTQLMQTVPSLLEMLPIPTKSEGQS